MLVPKNHFLCVLTVLTCLVSPAVSAAEKLRIAIPEFKRPSTMAAQRVLEQAYAQLGVDITFIATPALRAIALWESNQLDGIALKIIDDGLPDSIKVSVPVAFEEAVVFTKKLDFTVDGFASLKPYKVGYILGVTYLEERLKDIPYKETAPNLISMFKKLDVGRSDIAIDSRFSYCVAKKLGLQDIRVLEPSLEKRLGYHFLHKRHENLVAPLEAVLHKMELAGSIKKIQDETMQEFMSQCP